MFFFQSQDFKGDIYKSCIQFKVQVYSTGKENYNNSPVPLAELIIYKWKQLHGLHYNIQYKGIHLENWETILDKPFF